MNETEINLADLDNKTVYQHFIKNKITPNIGIIKWQRILGVKPLQIRHSLSFTNKEIYTNKLTVYKWKLFSYILPNTENLFKWKISNTSECALCKCTDNYQHFFIDCEFLKDLWNKITDKMNIINFCKKINLIDIVFGYKIGDRHYNDINLIITLIGFSIYKSFYTSEQRTKSADIYNIFKKEFELYFEQMCKKT